MEGQNQSKIRDLQIKQSIRIGLYKMTEQLTALPVKILPTRGRECILGSSQKLMDCKSEANSRHTG